MSRFLKLLPVAIPLIATLIGHQVARAAAPDFTGLAVDPPALTLTGQSAAQRLLVLKQACAVVQSASFSPRISARERCVPACFAGGENHYLHVAWG
jgi:hypothetical protein